MCRQKETVDWKDILLSAILRSLTAALLTGQSGDYQTSGSPDVCGERETRWGFG